MSGLVSLNKSLRTSKATPGLGPVAQGFRLFDTNMQCEIPQQLIEQYGRPSAMDAGLQFLGNGAPGCYSPEYRIDTENLLRPQYYTYLDVPQGVMKGGFSEYQNQPHKDLLGVNRDRAFGVDGVYRTMPYPANATNPASDKDWMLQQSWYANRTDQLFDSRLWLNSSSVESGF